MHIGAKSFTGYLFMQCKIFKLGYIKWLFIIKVGSLKSIMKAAGQGTKAIHEGNQGRDPRKAEVVDVD